MNVKRKKGLKTDIKNKFGGLMMLISEFIKRQTNESREDYIMRLAYARTQIDIGWGHLTNIINTELGEKNTKDAIRKFFSRRVGSKIEKNYSFEDKDIKSLDNLKEKLEIGKLKAKLSDERVQINSYIRKIAREETLKEIALDVAKNISSKKILSPVQKFVANSNKRREGILELSDIHYGAVISNYWNEYNPEIAKKYFSKLRNEVIEKCNLNDVNVIHIVNLGDLINGLIHLRIRLESRIDIVTQTIEISEILAEFLYDLAQKFDVHFYSCLDNHSRLDPNKKDSLDLESMARIIPWYLQTRVGHSVSFHDNKYDPEITTFRCNGFNILGVHGDKDRLNTIVEKMSVMTHEHYDLILTAHLHHFSCDEQNETLVVSNGSMLGTDTFAKNLRLTSRPSQNLIIVDKNNVAECIYRIILS